MEEALRAPVEDTTWNGHEHLWVWRPGELNVQTCLERGCKATLFNPRPSLDKDVMDKPETVEMRAQGGMHKDEGKPGIQYLEPTFLEAMAKVGDFGATQKYERYNYRRGIKCVKLMGSVLRHCFAYLRGEDMDEESKQSHLAHAAFDLMMVFVQKKEYDDREKL